MIAGTFLGIGADGFQLNGNFSGTDLKGSDDPTLADQILIWNAASGAYTTYFFFDYGEGGQWANAETYNYFETDYPNGAPAGTAFWFSALSRGAGELDPTVTFSGEVPSTSTYTFNLQKGTFNMIANPYPTSVSLNDTAQVQITGAVGTDDPSTADQILIWNAVSGAYTTYFFFNYGEGGQWANAETYNYFETDYPNGATNFSAWYLALSGSGTVDMTFTKLF